MRPCAIQAASSEPIAIEIEKTARYAVTTSSLAPSTPLTSGGISESATAPVSQNQLVVRLPHHNRLSTHKSFKSEPVERAMFGSMVRLGAPCPVRGMSRLDPQQASENTTISVAK
jgi:hypothetical protein